jgi:hypothetical protein
MTTPPAKLAAARLAAAEIFIADGLQGTAMHEAAATAQRLTAGAFKYDPADELRSVAGRTAFCVSYMARLGRIDVNVGFGDHDADVWVQTLGTSSSVDSAAEFAQVLQRAVAVARKVEAAIREVLR